LGGEEKKDIDKSSENNIENRRYLETGKIFATIYVLLVILEYAAELVQCLSAPTLANSHTSARPMQGHLPMRAKTPHKHRIPRKESAIRNRHSDNGQGNFVYPTATYQPLTHTLLASRRAFCKT